MHYISKDFITAVVPRIGSKQKEVLEDFFRASFNIDHTEFVFTESPEILFAHGATDSTAGRLCSRLRNSVVWQNEHRLAIISCQPDGVLTEGERCSLLTRAVENIERRLPGIDVYGVCLGKGNQVLMSEPAAA